MNDLQIFDNEDFGCLRTTVIDNEPWFVGKDVAMALGYTKPTDAVRSHVDPDDRGVSEIGTPGGLQSMTIINESGLYALIFGSKLESARKFKHWVTHDVLPALRKGSSILTPTGEELVTGLKYELTALDYMTAARTIAACRKDQLPYVLDLLLQAGFDFTALPEIRPLRGAEYTDEERDYFAQQLQTAIITARDAGMTYDEIGQIIGQHRSQVRYYYLGLSRARPKRAQAFVKALHDALPELYMETPTTE